MGDSGDAAGGGCVAKGTVCGPAAERIRGRPGFGPLCKFAISESASGEKRVCSPYWSPALFRNALPRVQQWSCEMGRALVDLTGNIVGRWTVIKLVRREAGGKAHWWLCRCTCGQERAVRGSSLRAGRSTSCGCAQIDAVRKLDQAERPGLMSLRVPDLYYRAIAHGAARRRLEFNLDHQGIQALLESQGGRCALSGLPISFDWTRGAKGTLARSTTASLGRIRSAEGYIEGNVHWLHKDVCFMKQRYGQGYLINLCTRIAEHCAQTPLDISDQDRGRALASYMGDKRDRRPKEAAHVPERAKTLQGCVLDALRQWELREHRGATANDLLASDLAWAKATPGTVRSYLGALERTGQAHKRRRDDDRRSVRWHAGSPARAEGSGGSAT